MTERLAVGVAGRNVVVDGVVMTCQEFLARHSEYLDEVMSPLDSVRWREHVSNCRSCARYDRVVRRTASLIQELPAVEPASDFFPRLQHRIYNLEDSKRMDDHAAGAGALVSLAVAGALALLAWSPLLRTAGGPGSWAGGIVERVAGEGSVAPRTGRAERRAGGSGLSVQLAAEGNADAQPAADSAGDGPTVPRIVPVRPIPSGLDTWWWDDPSAAGFSGATSVFRRVRSADLHVPGPYSPLVVGAPAHRPASVVRRIEVRSNR